MKLDILSNKRKTAPFMILFFCSKCSKYLDRSKDYIKERHSEFSADNLKIRPF